jgi:hypothetical protein
MPMRLPQSGPLKPANTSSTQMCYVAVIAR